MTGLFCKEPYKRDYILQKRPIILIVATPHAVLYVGWLRLVGSFKLQVFFAEYSVFYRALLQKRPIILRSLLIVATPYAVLYMMVLDNLL